MKGLNWMLLCSIILSRMKCIGMGISVRKWDFKKI